MRKLKEKLLAAELLHQRRLFFHQQQFAAIDHADTVGDLFRLLDIMRCQDDGDALGAQFGNHIPHVAAQSHIDAGGGFVKEQNLRLVRQRLGNQHAPFHAAGKLPQHIVLLAPERQGFQNTLDQLRVLLLPVQAAREADGVPNGLELVGRQLLRHEADQGAGLAKILHHVMPADKHRPLARIDETADDGDQRGLSGAIRPEKGKDFALSDIEADTL